MKNILLCILIIILPTLVFSQSLSDKTAKLFIEALVSDSNNLQNFVDTTEIRLSRRLGISYPNSKNKFLISNDLENSIREKLLVAKIKHQYNIRTLEPNYSLLTLEVPKENITLEYIFHNSKLISKPFYYSKNWKQIVSKYFVFHISDTNLINNYSISNLDSFVDRIVSVLDCNSYEIQKLEKEKIHYFLCKDESKIKQLTNYSARGLYFIPFDYIISTFNSHYHEITHLLINYKLKSINLFTLPLLQEGFAVANGGRGGKEPNVILDMGEFLVRSDFLDYDILLNKKDFYQFNTSMTYPVAGLYVKFLIESIGISKFLDLYKLYSTDLDNINSILISSKKLPSEESWKDFVNRQTNTSLIQISEIDDSNFVTPIINETDYSISESNSYYFLKIKNMVSIQVNENVINYKSKLFDDLFPENKYKNEKYILMANSDEVSVYNLYTNCLIAKYVKDFSNENKNVLQKDGFFLFSIKKDLFDESFQKWIINGS